MACAVYTLLFQKAIQTPLHLMPFLFTCIRTEPVDVSDDDVTDDDETKARLLWVKSLKRVRTQV